MTDQINQQRIARWLGWTQDADRPEYWYTCDDPGHEGEPRRLPDLTTFAGVAEWCALIKAKLEQLGDFDIGWIQASRDRPGSRIKEDTRK